MHITMKRHTLRKAKSYSLIGLCKNKTTDFTHNHARKCSIVTTMSYIECLKYTSLILSIDCYVLGCCYPKS